MNWQSFSQITFAFAVTPQLLAQGVVWATLIGLIGGLLPALRAARQPIAAALAGAVGRPGCRGRKTALNPAPWMLA